MVAMRDLVLQKKSKKEQRSWLVLLGLVELFIQTGRPVGSQTLQECGFGDLSSATIRNYFASLEADGLLAQQHSSGGRVPTEKAFRLYAEAIEKESKPKKISLEIEEPAKELSSWLDQLAERLAEKTQMAVVISAPRFDHDFIRTVKLVRLDNDRLLAVLITDFGLVKTEVLSCEDLNNEDINKIERYFLGRLQGAETPHLGSEKALAERLYHETMVRYLVGYSHFTHFDLHKKGFSTLLSYPECSDPVALAQILSLFEYEEALFSLLNETMRKGSLSFWIGKDLRSFCPGCDRASFITCPYSLHQRFVGAIGLLGPLRINYKELFPLLQETSAMVSELLTRSLYTFKLSFREPNGQNLYLTESENKLLIEKQS